MPVFVIQDPDVKDNGKRALHAGKRKSGYLPFFKYYARKLPKQDDAALADLCPLPKYRASAVVLPINPQYVFDLFLFCFSRSHDAIMFLDASYARDEVVGNREVRSCVVRVKGEEMCGERVEIKKKHFPGGVTPFTPSSAAQ
jgi:hypothetical protein